MCIRDSVYGTRYATTNAGLLYTAKGTASLVVPFGNVLMSASGGWHLVFVTGAIMNAIAAIMALMVLKPLRASHNAVQTGARPAEHSTS